MRYVHTHKFTYIPLYYGVLSVSKAATKPFERDENLSICNIASMNYIFINFFAIHIHTHTHAYASKLRYVHVVGYAFFA